MRVCLGGTFNILHKGHKLLIDKAIEKAGDNGKLSIGITMGDMTKIKEKVKSFYDRKKAIENYMSGKKEKLKIEIIPIFDKFGLAIDESYDVIVVSPETKKIAEEINRRRILKERKPLEILQIPYVLADDGKPISSSRIMRNEIDKDGRVTKNKK